MPNWSRRTAIALLMTLTVGCKSGAGSKSGVGGASGSGPTGAAGASGGGGAAGVGGSSSAGTTGTSGVDGAVTQDGGSSDGSIDFHDPVAGSECDATLTGTDSDGNGVRDDVDAYIATLESDSRRLTALVSFARESTAMMVLGGTDGTSKATALAQAQRVGRTIDCLHDLYLPDLATKQAIVQSVRNALYDNAMRLRAYNHASTLVSGTILRAGRGCDAAITGVSQ